MDEHHIFCNGIPASPIEGCHWCDGPKGFWATHPYSKPPMNNELERIEFLENEIARLMEALLSIEDLACHYANETVESLKSRIDGLYEIAQLAIYGPIYKREDLTIELDPEIACVCDSCGCGCPCLCGCRSCCPFTSELDEDSERILRQHLWNLYD